MCAKVVKAGNCKGILFDPEPYSNDNPWDYKTQLHSSERSFEEYEAIVRKRGSQFMNSLQKEMPNIKVFTLFQMSYLSYLMNEADVSKRYKYLEIDPYGLLVPFLNGMLDVCGPDVVIIDGNESSYWYKQPLDFYVAYHTIRQRVLPLIATENTRKYNSHVKVGQALYVDTVFGYYERAMGLSWSPQKRAEFFAQNAYYALLTTDEYVWCYSEKMNWWTGENIPLGCEEALLKARAKISGQEVDLTFPEISSRKSELGIIKRTARIKPTNGDKPNIDGVLDDKVWKEITTLDPFVQYVGRSTGPKAETNAWVTYDDKYLYIAFRCNEPRISEIEINDLNVWAGDSIDIFISPSKAGIPYYHLIINPNNKQWTALCKDSNANQQLPVHNYNWKSKVSISFDAWNAEFAIPWTDLNINPQRGMILSANLCRNRRPDSEQTSWSQNASGFLEPENFGYWVFE